MKRFIGNLGLALAVGLTLAGASAARAAVVYDNYTTDEHYNFDPTGHEVGDEVILATTTPQKPLIQLSQFQFNAFAQNFTANPFIDARVRFYQNDGAAVGAANRVRRR